MNKIKLLSFISCLLLFTSWSIPSDWGFFGHRLINRMAVFTLPSDMLPLFKSNIEYLTEHAVDPDKKRYANKHEAVRHYIDIDYWGEFPFPEVPRNFTNALMAYTEIVVISDDGSISYKPDRGQQYEFISFDKYKNNIKVDRISVDYDLYRSYFNLHVKSQYFNDEWVGNIDTLNALFNFEIKANSKIYFIDHFSEYGILPYHLLTDYYKLIKAFRSGDEDRIIRLCASLGHYIGDAHVPLHTTENYNGGMSNQEGIHAFWESRLPELYANTQYDFFVGKAELIDKPADYFWDIVLKSHSLLDDVLFFEAEVKKKMPEDLIYCYEDRLSRNVLLQCEEFSEKYHIALDGMVEDRMRSSILAIGSVWRSAWEEAGKPDLRNLNNGAVEDEAENAKLNEAHSQGISKGRKHE